MKNDPEAHMTSDCCRYEEAAHGGSNCNSSSSFHQRTLETHISYRLNPIKHDQNYKGKDSLTGHCIQQELKTNKRGKDFTLFCICC